MTDKQYKRYAEIEEELESIRLFIKGYKHTKLPFIKLFFAKPKFRLKRKQYSLCDAYDITVSGALQEKIIAVIEQYVDEKERRNIKIKLYLEMGLKNINDFKENS